MTTRSFSLLNRANKLDVSTEHWKRAGELEKGKPRGPRRRGGRSDAGGETRGRGGTGPNKSALAPYPMGLWRSAQMLSQSPALTQPDLESTKLGAQLLTPQPQSHLIRPTCLTPYSPPAPWLPPVHSHSPPPTLSARGLPEHHHLLGPRTAPSPRCRPAGSSALLHLLF